ncbi:hypothetical protein GLOIN_2v1488228 [Rhizophagus clarus]|uniref:Uncharacterized protein n=1 Tax=Rhizophagus clarus TaxID=94130 RepID=A0A8H3M338_9GLOM|nr:hypothetical protein GLOIN_2v1488228 [Rhizophagus clarus]
MDRLCELMISDLYRKTTNEESITQAIQIRALWDQFSELYHLIQDKNTTGEFFRYKAKSWLDAFTAPSIGHPNKSDFVRGMYHVQDITPYIHVVMTEIDGVM